MSLRSLAAVAGALLVISALFLWTSAASAPKSAQSAAPVAIAHRGASAYAPENTLAAVDRAHDLGVTWVENDVRRTADGELVVLHDTTLERTTDAEEVFPGQAPWRVADFTAEEIARLDAGSWFDEKYAGARVPTLEEYLRRIERNGQKLLLELKEPGLYPGIAGQTLKELANEGWLDRQHVRQRLILQSFNAEVVRTVHELAPEVRTGYLGTPSTAELSAYAAFTDQINPSWKTVTADYVSAVHALDGAHGKPLQVFTWTVDDAATAQEVAGANVDGIISNRPDVVRDAVGG
jgi:glycerophosphoryl diester phosphodiesterase